MLPKSFLYLIFLTTCLPINVLAGSKDIKEGSSTPAHLSQANGNERSYLSFSVSSEVTTESGSSEGKEGEPTSTETVEQGQSFNRYVFNDVKDRQKFRELEEKNELDTSNEDEDGLLNPVEIISTQQSEAQSRGNADDRDNSSNLISEETNTRERQENVAERGCENTEEKLSKPHESKISENTGEIEIVSQSVTNIRRQGDIGPQSTIDPGKVEFDDLRYDQTPPVAPPPPPPYPPHGTRKRNGFQGPRSDQGPSHGEPQLLLTYGGYQKPFQDSGSRFQQGYSNRPAVQPHFSTANVAADSGRPDSRVPPSQAFYGPPSSHQPDHEYRPENPFHSTFRPSILNFDEPRFLPSLRGPPPPVDFAPVQRPNSPPFQGFQNDVRNGYQHIPQPSVLGSNLPQFQRDDLFNRPPPSSFPSFLFRDIPSGGFPSASSDHLDDERFVEFRGPPPVEQSPFGSQQQDSNLTVSRQYPAVQPGERPSLNPFRSSESIPSVGPSFQANHLPFFTNSRPDFPVGPSSNFFSPFSNAVQPFNVFSGYQSPAQNQNDAVEDTAPNVSQHQSEESESVSGKQEAKEEQESRDSGEDYKVDREAPFGSRLTPTVSGGDNPFYISPGGLQVGYSGQAESPSSNTTNSEETGNTKPDRPSLFSVSGGFPGPREQQSPSIRGNNSPSQGDKPLYSQLSSIRGPFQETSADNNGPSERNVTGSPVHSFFGSVPFQTQYDRPSPPPHSNIFEEHSGRPQFLRSPLPDRIFSSPLVDTRISKPSFGSNELRPTSPGSVHHRNNGFHYFSVGDQPNSQDVNAVPVCAQKANVSICFEDAEYPRNEILHFVESDRYLADRLLVSPAQISRSSLVEGSEEIGDSDETENYVCKSLLKYGQPKRAKNSKGQWKILVNMEDDFAEGKLSQPVRLEVCSNPGGRCSHTSNSVATQCVQKYNFHRLLVWTPGRGLSLDVFKLPVACSCQVTAKE